LKGFPQSVHILLIQEPRKERRDYELGIKDLPRKTMIQVHKRELWISVCGMISRRDKGNLKRVKILFIEVS